MTAPAQGPSTGADRLLSALAELGLAGERVDGATVVVELPGEHKLTTAVSLRLGSHSLAVNAFVMRAPDQDADRLHSWLLRRNTGLFAVAYAVDRLGDVYLTGRLPLSAVDADVLDEVLGSVLAAADGDFDTLVAMGFADAIRAEWRWRLARGESTRNLEAFRRLAPT